MYIRGEEGRVLSGTIWYYLVLTLRGVELAAAVIFHHVSCRQRHARRRGGHWHCAAVPDGGLPLLEVLVPHAALYEIDECGEKDDEDKGEDAH